MLRVARRPYTDCPYRWQLIVEGVSGGEGSVSEQQCLNLVGTHLLDFKPCASQGQKLIWETECEASGNDTNDCTMSVFCSDPTSIINHNLLVVPAFPAGVDAEIVNTFNGYLVGGRSGACCVWGSEGQYYNLTTSNPLLYSAPWEDNGDGTYSVKALYQLRIDNVDLHTAPAWQGIKLTVIRTVGTGATASSTLDAVYESGPLTECQASFVLTKIVPLPATDSPCSGDDWIASEAPLDWQSSVTITPITGGSGVGPKVGDATRGRFRLEYDIPAEKYTLHSFERVLYPKWSLVDASPCSGEEKTLVLQERPSGSGDGCALAPPSVTITRACSPDRAANPHQRSKITGQLRRACGCACDDEVDDRRHTCQAKCTSTSTTGCESYSSDGIECKYPKPLDCCDYCTEDKTPCAYEALFDCEIKHNGVSIAAPVVTLRKDCYFENVCEYVAIGPSPNAADGGTGAQPACATCVDSCLSGCSWDAWQTAECPVYCESAEYTALVASRAGKCLRLSWGTNSSNKTDPPGYVDGGVITILTPTGTDGSGYYVFGPDEDGWNVTTHPSVPTPNDCGGCGFMHVTTPSNSEWTDWYLENWAFTFSRWTAGVGCCASRSPYADAIVDMRPHDTFGVCFDIPILAEWIDCP